MCTDAEKSAILSAIRDKAMIADRVGLTATAQSWRDLLAAVMERPAGDILLATSIAEQPLE